MILHIINKSPFSHHSLNSCLKNLNEEDSILLIEDGVFLLTNPNIEPALDMSNTKLHALKNDMTSRGVGALAHQNIGYVDYSGFVDLVCEHSKTMTWF